MRRSVKLPAFRNDRRGSASLDELVEEAEAYFEDDEDGSDADEGEDEDEEA